ncbi:MAG: DNA-directed RNA polymerase subunit N [Candidatus Diapherotrites archaeon]|nr:DNA-directed RNA polymerase subunit N [Candidatus Diapherotrites archaeon]
MIIPIRCFSCGKPIAAAYEEFRQRTEKEDPKKVMEELGIRKYCCRRMLISHVNLLDDVSKFSV